MLLTKSHQKNVPCNEKLAEEEVNDIHCYIHGVSDECNKTKQRYTENGNISYPTMVSLHKVISETEKYPGLSNVTFYNI